MTWSDSNDSPFDARPARRVRFGSLIALLMILTIIAVVMLLLIIEVFRRDGDHPAVGKRLPALALQPLTGTDQPVALEDLQDKVVLIDFWGTWCPPCRAAMPHLIEVSKTVGNHPDFRFLAISCGSQLPEDLDELRAATSVFLEKNRFDIPTYADPQLTTRRAFDSLQKFQGYPTTVILDRQGVIRRVWVGNDPRAPRQLQELIPELLKQ